MHIIQVEILSPNTDPLENSLRFFFMLWDSPAPSGQYRIIIKVMLFASLSIWGKINQINQSCEETFYPQIIGQPEDKTSFLFFKSFSAGENKLLLDIKNPVKLEITCPFSKCSRKPCLLVKVCKYGSTHPWIQREAEMKLKYM